MLIISLNFIFAQQVYQNKKGVIVKLGDLSSKKQLKLTLVLKLVSSKENCAIMFGEYYLTECENMKFFNFKYKKVEYIIAETEPQISDLQTTDELVAVYKDETKRIKEGDCVAISDVHLSWIRGSKCDSDIEILYGDNCDKTYRVIDAGTRILANEMKILAPAYEPCY